METHVGGRDKREATTPGGPRPLGVGAWIAISVGGCLVLGTAVVKLVILMVSVLCFAILGMVVLATYAEVPFESSPPTSLAGEWVLDPGTADMSVHIDADGFVTLEDWPVDLLCPEAGRELHGPEDLDWSWTMTVSGVAATDERVSVVEVLLDPLPRGCNTWQEISVEGEPASGDSRLVVFLNGPADAVEGIEPLVLERVGSADRATSGLLTTGAGAPKPARP